MHSKGRGQLLLSSTTIIPSPTDAPQSPQRSMPTPSPRPPPHPPSRCSPLSRRSRRHPHGPHVRGARRARGRRRPRLRGSLVGRKSTNPYVALALPCTRTCTCTCTCTHLSLSKHAVGGAISQHLRFLHPALHQQPRAHLIDATKPI